MKKITLYLTFLILTHVILSTVYINLVDAEQHFTDVQSGYWAEDAIYYLSDRGIIVGYDNGKFGPDDKITREQAALILMRVLYPEEKAKTNVTYSDVSNENFYYQSIALTTENGIFDGFPNGEFKPKEYISRAATAKIFSIAFDLKGSNATFTDLTEAPWASRYIKALASNQIVNGYPDQTFRPKNAITRAEFSSALVKILDTSSRGEISGIVNNEDSEVISGASVEVLDLDGNLVKKTKTDKTGSFSFNLIEGNYIVKVNVEGYKQSSQSLPVVKAKEAKLTYTLISTVTVSDPEASENGFEFLELNIPYKSPDNHLTITMKDIRSVDRGDYIEYIISYKETNNSNNQVLDQGSFKIYYKNGESDLQSGLFKKLYPIESDSRTYIFKAIKDEVDEPLLVEYGVDLRSKKEPTEKSLKWSFPSPTESDHAQ